MLRQSLDPMLRSAGPATGSTWGSLHSNLQQSFNSQVHKLQQSRARVEVAGETLVGLRDEIVALDSSISRVQEDLRVAEENTSVLSVRSLELKSTNRANSDAEQRTFEQRKDARLEYVLRLREQSAVMHRAWQAVQSTAAAEPLVDDLVGLVASLEESLDVRGPHTQPR